MLRTVYDSNQERRLKPIYDCLDSGNFRRALQESDRLLKKQPDYSIAKALKALSYIRLKKFDVAKAIIHDIDSNNVDHLTVQALTYCYRELGDPEKLVALYQNVTKKHPQNEEFLFQLALSYGRIGEYKMMSLTSMHLYRLSPTQPMYYFWSVMCHVLQADTQPDLAKTMHLPLATKMTEKYFATNSDNITTQQVLLYLHILQKQSRWQDIVEFTDNGSCPSHLAEKQSVRAVRLEALQVLGRHRDTWRTCRDLIEIEPNDIAAWVYMISAVIEIAKQQDQEDTKQLVLSTAEFMNSQVEIALSKPNVTKHSRAQQLGRIFFVFQLLEHRVVSENQLAEFRLEHPVQMMVLYFEHFSARPCLFLDFEELIWQLSDENRRDLLEKLVPLAGGLSVHLVGDDEELQWPIGGKEAFRHSTLLQLCCTSDVYKELNEPERLAFARQCHQRHLKAVSTAQTDLLSRSDYMHASRQYLMVCIAQLWEVYTMNEDDKILHKIVAILIGAVSTHKENPLFKVILVKIYSILASPSRIGDAFDALEAKYILIDCLWYLLAGQLASFGYFSQFLLYTSGCADFYTSVIREMTDCFLMSLKSGAYVKALTGIEMEANVRNSANKQFCSIDQLYYRILVAYKSFEELKLELSSILGNSHVFREECNWSKLVDNRDFTLVPGLINKEKKSLITKYNSKMFNVLICRAKFHYGLLQLFKLFFNLKPIPCSSGDSAELPGAQQEADNKNCNVMNGNLIGNDDQALFEQLLGCVEELKRTLQEGRADKPTFDRQYSLYGSPPCYFTIALNANYLDVVCTIADVSVKFLQHVYQLATKTEEKSGDAPFEDVGSYLPNQHDIQEQLRVMFNAHQFSKSEEPIFPYMQTFHVALIIETLLVSSFICSAVKYLTIAFRRELMKQNKKKLKKRQCAHYSTLITLFKKLDDFQGVIVSTVGSLDRMIEDLQMMLSVDVSTLTLNDGGDNVAQNARDSDARKVYSKLCDSYKLSVNELKAASGHLFAVLQNATNWK